ncbi:MAG: TRAP transporter substrate-binding protein DctP [Pseudomonadota bacterium]
MAVTLLSAVPSCRGDTIIRIGSHLQARTTAISKIVLPWLEAVRAEVGDQVTIREYWGGSLGRHADKQMELVQSGVLDIGYVVPAYTSGQFPELGIFELPYFFESAEVAGLVGWSLYEQEKLSGFDRVHLLGIFTTQPAGLFMRTPVTRVEDLRGLKVRSLGAIHNSWLEAFGAAAQTMNPIDMNQSLSRGMLDGGIQGWSGMRTFDSFPLVDQAWSVPLGTTAFLLLINQQSWERLPEPVRKAMRKHGGPALARASALAFQAFGERIQSDLRRENRVAIVAPDEGIEAEFRRRSKDIHRAWAMRTPTGSEIFDAATRLRDDLLSDGVIEN